MTHYTITELTPPTHHTWDDFNNHNPTGSLFHTLKWNTVIEQSFHHTKHFYMITTNQHTVALCPFYESTLHGFRGLIPIPESDYRHIITTDHDITPQLTKTILDYATAICKDHHLSFILLSTLSKPFYDTLTPYHPFPFQESGTMVLDLETTPPNTIWDTIFTTIGDGVPRKYIRRFEKEGFTIRTTREKNDLERFYHYYNENLTFIGAKPYPLSHFTCCLNHYTENEARITLLEKDHQIYGGLFSFISQPRQTMYLKYLALNRNTPNKYHPPYALYWEAIQHANSLGLRSVCFGSTPIDPENVTHRMKQKFGTTFIPEYRAVIPQTKLFSASYKAYNLLKKR
jgi:hypothetical protein